MTTTIRQIGSRLTSDLGRAAGRPSIIGVLALALTLSACSAPAADPTGVSIDTSPTPSAASSATVAEPTVAAGQLTAVTTGSLSAADAAGLLWMREEEKLARDIYLALADTWELRVFANIAKSEQSHMDAVATLLDRYGLEDPVGSNPPGVFSDSAIQALYDDLLTRGSASLTQALAVGAEIEELDIADLRARQSAVADIARVYANLEMGSGNHLRAFVSNLERRGSTYSPTHLSQPDFDAIVAATRSRGGQGIGH